MLVLCQRSDPTSLAPTASSLGDFAISGLGFRVKATFRVLRFRV